MMTLEPLHKKRRTIIASGISLNGNNDDDILVDDILFEIAQAMSFREQCQAQRISKQWQRCIRRAVHKVLITTHPWTLGLLLEQFPNITELAVNSRLVWTPLSDGFHFQQLPNYVPLLTRLDIEMDASAAPQWGFLSKLKNLKEFKFIMSSNRIDGTNEIWNEIPTTVETLTIMIRDVVKLDELLSHLRSLKTLIVDCTWDHLNDSSGFTLPTGLEEFSIRIGSMTHVSVNMESLLGWLHHSKLQTSLRCLKLWGGFHSFPDEWSLVDIFPLVETLGLFGFGNDVHVPSFDAFPNVTHLMTDSRLKSCHPANFPKLRHLSIDIYNGMPDAHLIWMNTSLTSISVHMRLKNKKPDTEIRMVQIIEVLVAIQRHTLKEITIHGPLPWSIFKWNMFYNLPVLEKIRLTERYVFDTLSNVEQPRTLPVVYVDKGHDFDFIKEEK